MGEVWNREKVFNFGGVHLLEVLLYQYCSCYLHVIESEQISKMDGLSCIHRVNGVIKHSDLEYDIFKYLLL